MDRRVLLPTPACQAGRLRGGRRMRGPAKDATRGLHAPSGGGVCAPWQRLPRVAPPNPPDPARACLAGGRVVCDDGWIG